MGIALPINHKNPSYMEFLSPFYYTYFLFEIYTVLKEDDIKNVLGYNFFQLLLWAKIFYRWDNQAVEICLSSKNIICQQLLPMQRNMYWASQIE